MLKWLKDAWLGIVTAAALFFAFVGHKANKDRLRDAQEEAEAIERAMRENAEADNSDKGSELDKATRDEFGKR